MDDALPRKTRGRLDRDAIVDAALALADREGLEAVSMRAVAAEIGAPPMSLYRRVASKAQLLERMFERVVDRIASVPWEGTDDWEDDVATLFRHARAVLLAHPSWVPLLTQIGSPAGALAAYERLTLRMRRSGVSPTISFRTLTTLAGTTLGFVLAELMMRGDEMPIPKQQMTKALHVVAQDGPGRFPGVLRAAPRIEKWSFERAFEGALRAELESARPRPRMRAHG